MFRDSSLNDSRVLAQQEEHPDLVCGMLGALIRREDLQGVALRRVLLTPADVRLRKLPLADFLRKEVHVIPGIQRRLVISTEQRVTLTTLGLP